MLTKTEAKITEPTRVRNFANFFKNYMSIWSVVVAALPIPITKLNLIPVFEFQKQVLSTYTTLFCFLTLGFIFYMRHRIAKYFFPDYFYEIQKQKILREEGVFSGSLDDEKIKKSIREVDHRRKQNNILLARRQKVLSITSLLFDMLPFIFIIASIYFAFKYHGTIEYLISINDNTLRKVVLQSASIPTFYSTQLMISYLSIFIFAEAAFILMAIKEYLQDLLQISDISLMINVYEESSPNKVSTTSATKVIVQTENPSLTTSQE